MPIESSPCSSIASQHFSRILGTSTPSLCICSPRSTPNVGRVGGGNAWAVLNDWPVLKLEMEGRGERAGRAAWGAG